jgi:hypothetical protein
MAQNPGHINQVENLHPYHHKLLCWRSIISGVLISALVYLILAALGAGIVGSTAETLIRNEEPGWGLATGAGLWLGLSVVISLFIGSYFCVRTSKFVTRKIGVTHGMVVTSLFFIVLMWGAGNIVGGISKGLGKAVASAGSSAKELIKNSSVQDTVHKALGASTLKSDPKEVSQELAMRLAEGNIQSAKDYFAYQTGLSPAEVDTKVTELKTEFDQAAKLAGEKLATAVAEAGWSLFAILMVGLLGAVAGGLTAAIVNGERPISRFQHEPRNQAAHS